MGRTLAIAGLLALGMPLGLQPGPSAGDGETAGGLDRAILADPARPEEDRVQDGDRRALDVYAWLGIGPGATVADLFPGGGYNTHLLSLVVGDRGKVFSVFEFYADREAFDGQVYKVPEVEARVEKGGLDNVVLLEKLGELPEGALDAAIAVRNYHDVEWVFPGLKRKEVVAAIRRALKPGGVVGIVEVATDREGWDAETHRLNEAVVIEDFTSGGFELAGRSDLLRNPEDDHAKSGFREGRQTMDRYLLKFRKN